MELETATGEMPLIAILRGIEVGVVIDVGAALIESGIVAIEVPLNLPRAMTSIEHLASRYAGQAAIGAGTVTDACVVTELAARGCRFVVSPDTNPAVIAASLASGMTPVPGFLTPSEAFAAVHAGARMLKLFPADSAGRGHLRALRAVLPATVAVFAVGGVDAGSMAGWIEAGANGFGIGTWLYTPGRTIAAIKNRAESLVRTMAAVKTEAAGNN